MLPNKEERDLYYTYDMNGWLKRITIRVFGLFFVSVLVSCGIGSTPPATPEVDSTPTSRPPALNQLSAEFLPTICNCVLRFDHINIEQGLSQSSVFVIFQDSHGFLWFGTEDGLNRYDGYSFKIFKPDPDVPTSLSDRWITSIVEDEEGYLWIGTRQGGLNRYDPRNEQFEHFLHNSSDISSLSNNQINTLLVDHDNYLWVGTSDGLDMFLPAGGTFSHYASKPTQADGISGKNITALYQDSKGRYWAGTSAGGLNRFEPKTKTFTSYQNSPDNIRTISNNYVTAISDTGNGNLWVGTRNGLNYFEPESGLFEQYFHSDDNKQSLINNTITSLQLDSTGNLWIGTLAGLDRREMNVYRFIHYRNDPGFLQSLSKDHVTSIFEDRGGVLWFGTRGGGVNKYDRQRNNFAYYRHDPLNPTSLSGNFIFPIFVDSDGVAWIGTESTGLNRFTWYTNLVMRFEHDPGKPESIISNNILSIAEDQDGLLWIGTADGLDSMDRDTFAITHYQRDTSNPDSLSGNTVYSVFVDSENVLWLGTANSLDRFNRATGTFTHYSPWSADPNNAGNNAISVIREDRDKNLWIGMFEGGLIKFDRRTIKFVRYRFDPENKQSLSNDTVQAIYQDTTGRLWIGTDGGLNLYHPESDTFTYYLEKDGLPNNVVYGILEDEHGYLWLSTNYGLSRFAPETATFRNFDAGDGLQSNEFNGNAYAKGRSGEFYFGGINGLTVFRPLSITDNPYLPQVTVTSLSQGDQPIKTSTSVETAHDLTITYPQNSLEFEFAALSYNQPDKNQYAYKLDGFDNWHYIGTKRDGRYTNLPGGKYTLLLKATNSDGVWNEEPLRINVTVIPPFWQTMWFQVLMVVAAFFVVVGGFRLRTKAIQDRNRELERLVRERTSALEKRSQEVQALYEADERILRNVSLNQVFQTLVDVAVETLHADRSVVFAWDETKSKVVPRVSHGFSPETLKVLHFAKGEGVVGEVFSTGKPAIFRYMEPNGFRPEVRAAIQEEGIRSFVHLPIVVDHKVVGVFNVGFTTPNLIGDDTMRLFSALTHRASISIANMELFEQTKDLAVMEERNRLARDLHDSAKQKAFAALAQLGTARGILNGHDDSAKLHLNEAENLVSDVIQELTFLVQEIYPMALQEKGLTAILREHIYEWENRNDMKVQLTTRNERRLSLDVEQALYRVTQETLANVARHSHANRVDISLVYNPDSVQLSISDDGQGFDTNQKSHGMGLRSIRERISSIRGTVQVQSAPGHGTRVLVQVPTKG
jgi:ligand-binding sensor domain-containing protein/signal transduction histidine kinase